MNRKLSLNNEVSSIFWFLTNLHSLNSFLQKNKIINFWIYKIKIFNQTFRLRSSSYFYDKLIIRYYMNASLSWIVLESDSIFIKTLVISDTVNYFRYWEILFKVSHNLIS